MGGDGSDKQNNHRTVWQQHHNTFPFQDLIKIGIKNDKVMFVLTIPLVNMLCGRLHQHITSYAAGSTVLLTQLTKWHLSLWLNWDGQQEHCFECVVMGKPGNHAQTPSSSKKPPPKKPKKQNKTLFLKQSCPKDSLEPASPQNKIVAWRGFGIHSPALTHDWPSWKSLIKIFR